ncbi:hypothetical protein [Nonomuraea aurantiaca]|nr:hypothetical protein [Nonomuraea aurantiaca]
MLRLDFEPDHPGIGMSSSRTILEPDGARAPALLPSSKLWAVEG